jgi:hypothetical protein
MFAVVMSMMWKGTRYGRTTIADYGLCFRPRPSRKRSIKRNTTAWQRDCRGISMANRNRKLTRPPLKAWVREKWQGAACYIQRDSDQRPSARSDQLQVALVGHTNAGTSSLMRALTGSVEDKLFATLDTTARALKSETKPRVLVSDTVGFIKKLRRSRRVRSDPRLQRRSRRRCCCSSSTRPI